MAYQERQVKNPADVWGAMKNDVFSGQIHLRDIEHTFGKGSLRFLAALEPLVERAQRWRMHWLGRSVCRRSYRERFSQGERLLHGLIQRQRTACRPGRVESNITERGAHFRERGVICREVAWQRVGNVELPQGR
jgi:hypothetical protein